MARTFSSWPPGIGTRNTGSSCIRTKEGNTKTWAELELIAGALRCHLYARGFIYTKCSIVHICSGYSQYLRCVEQLPRVVVRDRTTGSPVGKHLTAEPMSSTLHGTVRHARRQIRVYVHIYAYMHINR